MAAKATDNCGYRLRILGMSTEGLIMWLLIINLLAFSAMVAVPALGEAAAQKTRQDCAAEFNAQKASILAVGQTEEGFIAFCLSTAGAADTGAAPTGVSRLQLESIPPGGIRSIER
jgi:hypothetical protein